MADSTITITGNITRDPELRFFSSGTGKATFGVAVNERRPGKDGEWVEETSYFDVEAWGTLGENVAECLAKGTRVIVSGVLKQDTWESDGQKRSKVYIKANGIGPDLRWATAQVSRTARTNGANGAGARPSQGAPDPLDDAFAPAGDDNPF